MERGSADLARRTSRWGLKKYYTWGYPSEQRKLALQNGTDRERFILARIYQAQSVRQIRSAARSTITLLHERNASQRDATRTPPPLFNSSKIRTYKDRSLDTPINSRTYIRYRASTGCIKSHRRGIPRCRDRSIYMICTQTTRVFAQNKPATTDGRIE